MSANPLPGEAGSLSGKPPRAEMTMPMSESPPREEPLQDQSWIVTVHTLFSH